MSVIDEIKKNKDDFILVYGKEPTTATLGKTTYNQLKTEIFFSTYSNTEIEKKLLTEGLKNIRVHGLKIKQSQAEEVIIISD